MQQHVELKDPAKVTFEIVPLKKISAATNCSLLSGASLRHIKTTATNGSKLNITSKVKYAHVVESFLASVSVDGAMEGVQKDVQRLPEGLARLKLHSGPVRDKV